MTKILIRAGILLIGIAIVLVARGLFFYNELSGFLPGRAAGESNGVTPGYENIVVPSALSTDFVDVYEKGEGIVLIDKAHINAFGKEELNILMLRLVSRGLSVKFLGIGDDLETELTGTSKEEKLLEKETTTAADNTTEAPEADEEEAPSAAIAFIVVGPLSAFSAGEIKIIDEYVSNGGKLLLIADPTRSTEINSLALKFGLLFEPDYLYNMKENDINYRNIFVTDFKDNQITKNLKKIAFYTTGSISSANSSLAFVDENTFSNIIETRKRLSPIALAQDNKVLAIYDLTFLSEPYNGILDNNQLISNIADWLMQPGKETKSR